LSTFIHSHKAAGIQIGHAGRKASTVEPFFKATTKKESVPLEEGGWITHGASAIPWGENYTTPEELSVTQIRTMVGDFGRAAFRAHKAGFDVLEIHGAHGYLLQSFLSPLSNKRTDEYGGSFEGRTRLFLEVTAHVRAIWPKHKPLFVRLSCTDWVEGGWDQEQTLRLVALLKDIGADVIDCSSAGNHPSQKIPAGPLFQVPFAEEIKKKTSILTAAVGLITTPEQCESIVKEGKADIVLLAREFLREPYFAVKAAAKLGVQVGTAPQYHRAYPRPHI